MKSISTLLTLFLAFSAEAGLEGVWSGDGTLRTPEQSSECSYLSVQLAKSAEELTLAIDYSCGDNYEYVSLSAEVNGKTVLQDGQKIGTYSDSDMNLTFYNGDYMATVTAKLEPHDKLKFFFKEANQDGDARLKLDAILSRGDYAEPPEEEDPYDPGDEDEPYGPGDR
jgi:hypothetical protein